MQDVSDVHTSSFIDSDEPKMALRPEKFPGLLRNRLQPEEGNKCRACQRCQLLSGKRNERLITKRIFCNVSIFCIYLFVYLFIYFFIFLFLYFFLSFSISFFLYCFISLFICLFIYLFVYLFIYLFIYLQAKLYQWTTNTLTIASYADVLRLVTRSSPRTSAQRTGHFRSFVSKEPIHCSVKMLTSLLFVCPAVCYHCMCSCSIFAFVGQNAEKKDFPVKCCLLGAGPGCFIRILCK